MMQRKWLIGVVAGTVIVGNACDVLARGGQGGGRGGQGGGRGGSTSRGAHVGGGRDTGGARGGNQSGPHGGGQGKGRSNSSLTGDYALEQFLKEAEGLNGKALMDSQKMQLHNCVNARNSAMRAAQDEFQKGRQGLLGPGGDKAR